MEYRGAIIFLKSGFLITGILLKSKEAVENGKTNKIFIWKQFYIRRFVRISTHCPIWLFCYGLF
jgi:peptidoglycan/LPS O-acetylase OafA/YrhL